MVVTQSGCGTLLFGWWRPRWEGVDWARTQAACSYVSPVGPLSAERARAIGDTDDPRALGRWAHLLAGRIHRSRGPLHTGTWSLTPEDWMTDRAGSTHSAEQWHDAVHADHPSGFVDWRSTAASRQILPLRALSNPDTPPASRRGASSRARTACHRCCCGGSAVSIAASCSTGTTASLRPVPRGSRRTLSSLLQPVLATPKPSAPGPCAPMRTGCCALSGERRIATRSRPSPSRPRGRSWRKNYTRSPQCLPERVPGKCPTAALAGYIRPMNKSPAGFPECQRSARTNSD